MERPNRQAALALLAEMQPPATGRPRIERAKALLGITAERKAALHIKITGEITAETATRVLNELRGNPKAKTLFVEINSHGGDDAASWSIYRAIRAHAAPRKVALGLEQVASAAITIFASCDVRRVLPGTAMLLHGVAQDPETAARWTASAYSDRAEMLKAKDSRLAKELAERCGSPLPVWQAELSSEAPLPLDKAQSIGLVHEIVGQGVTLSKSWPERARSTMRSAKRFVHGSDAYRYAEHYLNACRIGGR